MRKGIILGLMLSFMATLPACAKNPGEVAEDFTINDIDGNEINLSKILSGKPALLDFWASWCPPCRKEIPRVQEFHEKYKDKVTVVGINVSESKEAVSSFVKKLNITYPMAIDSGEIANSFGVVGIPTIVLIGKDRKILYYGHSVREAEQHLP